MIMVPIPFTMPGTLEKSTSAKFSKWPLPKGLPKKTQERAAAITTIVESITTFTLSNGFPSVEEKASTVISAESIHALECTSRLTPIAVTTHPPTRTISLTGIDSG